MLTISHGEYIRAVVQLEINHKSATNSLMQDVSKDYPLWYKLIEGLLAQIVGNFNDAYVSNVHRALLHMGLCSHRPVRVSILTPSTIESVGNGYASVEC